MKNQRFKFSLIAFITALWLALLPGLAEAQVPSGFPREGYSYVTKNVNVQWMVWSDVTRLTDTSIDMAYEHETIFFQSDFANRQGAAWDGNDSQDPWYWWSDLPASYRDTTTLDSFGSGAAAGCNGCDNFTIGSADPQLIQPNVLYRTIDLLQDDNSNSTVSRVRVNGQLVKNPGPYWKNLWCPIGGNGRWCFSDAFATYGLTTLRAPIKFTDATGDYLIHYTTATGNTGDTQARRDILGQQEIKDASGNITTPGQIGVTERDYRFKGSMFDLESVPSWQPPWEFRRMAFEFLGQPLGTGIYVYQASYPGLSLRYTEFWDPTLQAWTGWHQE